MRRCTAAVRAAAVHRVGSRLVEPAALGTVGTNNCSGCGGGDAGLFENPSLWEERTVLTVLH